MRETKAASGQGNHSGKDEIGKGCGDSCTRAELFVEISGEINKTPLPYFAVIVPYGL